MKQNPNQTPKKKLFTIIIQTIATSELEILTS